MSIANSARRAARCLLLSALLVGAAAQVGQAESLVEIGQAMESEKPYSLYSKGSLALGVDNNAARAKDEREFELLGRAIAGIDFNYTATETQALLFSYLGALQYFSESHQADSVINTLNGRYSYHSERFYYVGVGLKSQRTRELNARSFDNIVANTGLSALPEPEGFGYEADLGYASHRSWKTPNVLRKQIDYVESWAKIIPLWYQAELWHYKFGIDSRKREFDALAYSSNRQARSNLREDDRDGLVAEANYSDLYDWNNRLELNRLRSNNYGLHGWSSRFESSVSTFLAERWLLNLLAAVARTTYDKNDDIAQMARDAEAARKRLVSEEDDTMHRIDARLSYLYSDSVDLFLDYSRTSNEGDQSRYFSRDAIFIGVELRQ